MVYTPRQTAFRTDARKKLPPIDWTSLPEVRDYALHTIGKNKMVRLSIIKRQGRENFNIIHTSEEYRLLKNATLIERVDSFGVWKITEEEVTCSQ